MLSASLELSFKVADDSHPGQVWATAAVNLDTPKTEEDDEIQNGLESVTSGCRLSNCPKDARKNNSNEPTPFLVAHSKPSPSPVMKMNLEQVDWHSAACLGKKEVNVHIYGWEYGSWALKEEF